MKSDQMELKIAALPVNEGFARSTVAAFCARTNPTVEEIGDIKTAVSEAVTNCIVHAYEYRGGDIAISVTIEGGQVSILIIDYGKGIPDIAKAMQPFYTTKPQEERSGMGFTLMEAFMDELTVESQEGRGTSVKLVKYIKNLVGGGNAGA